MKVVVRALALAALVAVCAAAQPAIYTNGIVNGASFAPAGLPNSNIAQGSIFSIFGQNMGPLTGTYGSFPLPTSLANVKVHVTPQGASTPIDAILLFVRADQINAVMPSTVPAGSATVTVEFNGQTSPVPNWTITVVPSSVGLFAVNQAGSGPAALQNYIDQSTPPKQNSVTDAAHPGQVVTLWGTGIGPVSFDETQAPGANAKDMTGQLGVKVYVAGRQITPQYAGRSSQFAGEDQINFQLPSDIAAGCYVPVTVKVGNVISNSTSLSIASTGSVCTDALTDIPSSVDQNYRVGGIALTSISTTAGGKSFSMDTAGASFFKYAGAALGQLKGTFGVSTYGACTVYTYKGESATFTDNTTYVGLDAGPQLTLTTPTGDKTMTKTALAPGVYSIPFTPDPTNPFPSFLTPGNYKITVPGGADVGAFEKTLTVPERLVWKNMADIAGTPINRGNSLQVTWTGGAQDDAIIILGSSTLADKSAGAGFYCVAKDSDLQFTIPADVLSTLPASGADTGFMGVADFPTSSKFKIDPTPSGLDTATFTYQFMSASAVTFQ